MLLVALVPIAWLLIVWRWRFGVYALLAYLPFSGIPILLFFPSAIPVLFKDILFIIPLYLAFPGGGRLGPAWQLVPTSVRASVVAVASLVVVQALNPNVENWLVAAIGLKVWLTYIPLMLVAAVFFVDPNSRIRLLRMMIGLAWIPYAVGLLQWLGSLSIGYQETMELYYGELAAEAATQGFNQFDDTGRGAFLRIPSVFSYVTQYLGFILGTITVCHVAVNTDPSSGWRKLAWATWALSILSGFLCGARAAYLFVPLLLACTFLFSGRTAAGLAAAATVPLAGLLAAAIGQFDLVEVVQMVFGITQDYGEDIAFTFIGRALSDTVFGMGAGTNTGAARFAFDHPDLFFIYENYYAKVAYELGLLGLFVYVAFELTVLWHAVKLLRSSRGQQADVVAGLLAFFVVIFLNNFKGWQMDLDPINVYFWLFLGLLWSVRAWTQDQGTPARRWLQGMRPAAPECAPAYEAARRSGAQ